MIAFEQVSIREPILGSGDFGPEQIKILDNALAAGQAGEMRQHLQELEDRASSPRDLLACGIVAYMLTRWASIAFRKAQRIRRETKARKLARNNERA